MHLLLLARAIGISVIAFGAGCAHPPKQQSCADVGGMPMIEYQLFFGRSIVGRSALTDREWAEFAEQVVTPRLPDGFTAFDAGGQWMNPATRRIVKENTKVVIVALPATEAAASAIEAVRDAYRARFHQQSVGMTAHPVCGSF
jgi:hypothetical protein